MVIHPLHQLIDPGFLNRFLLAGKGAADEIFGQPDTAHGHGRLAGKLLGPACEVQIRAFKLRLPEPAGRGVENVHTGFHQWLQEPFEFLRAVHQFGFVILLLPLGEPQHDREIRPDAMAHRLNDFDHKAQAVFHRAAVFIVPLVGAFPQELVQQVAMGTVDLDTIKTEGFGILGGIGKGGDHVLNILFGHGFAVGLARAKQTGWAVTGHRRIRRCAFLAYGANVPELRENGSTGFVHGINNVFPALKGVGTMKCRHIGITTGGGVIYCSAFGNDQTNAGFGAALIIGHNILTRHTIRREVAGHRCHRHPVTQLEVVKFKRFEKRAKIHAHGNVQPY